MRGLKGLTAAWLLVLAAPPTAQALTRAQADGIALRRLRPTALRGNLILFGLPKPLPRGTVVTPADPPRGAPGGTQRYSVQPLRDPTWLYWLDLAPYAYFSHPSRFLLVDDTNGRVIGGGAIGWYPSVNTSQPPFIATRRGYDSARYRIYARMTVKTPGRGVATALVAPHLGARIGLTSRPAKAADAFPGSPPVKLPPGALAHDCVLMLGDYRDQHFARDFVALQAWGQTVGIRSYYVTADGVNKAPPPENASPPTGPGLDKAVSVLVAEAKAPCTDVLIYMSGHGVSASEGPPTVITGEVAQIALTAKPTIRKSSVGVDAAWVAHAIGAHPSIDFKLKIDSCYSGRFIEALTLPGPSGTRRARYPNLLIAEASSAPDQVSYSYLGQNERRSNPLQVGEFTNQNLAGLEQFFSSQDEVAGAVALGGDLFAHALERAFGLGRSANLAIGLPNMPAVPILFTHLFGDSTQPGTVSTPIALAALTKPDEIVAGPTAAPGVGRAVRERSSGTGASLWFTEFGADKIATFAPGPKPRVREFSLGAGAAPEGIALGPDGNIWFTETNGNQIGRITPSGILSEFPVPTAGSFPEGISAGPDGNLWFTELNGNKVGRITPAGAISEFPLPHPGSLPTGITSAPGGDLWLVEGAGRVARVSTGGNLISEFPLPTADSFPTSITVGPDGNVWLTENHGNKIARIDAAATTLTEYSLQTPNSRPLTVVGGPDGNIWFTESGIGRVGRITTRGTGDHHRVPAGRGRG